MMITIHSNSPTAAPFTPALLFRTARKRFSGLVILSILLMPLAASAQPSPHFSPDWLFNASTLSGHTTVGQADWSAQNGTVSANISGEGGWLIFDQTFQDAQFYLRFNCPDTCNAGVMLRAEKTPDGSGYSGTYVSLTDSLRIFYVTLDGNGQEIKRTSLTGAPSMTRIAPAMGADQQDPVRHQPLEGNRWHTLTIAIDANIVRTYLDGWNFASSSAVTGDDAAGYGALALYAGGNTAFADIAVMDYNTRTVVPEKQSDNFSMQRLDEFYYAWDTAIADIDQDGTLDVVAGPYYFTGPEYTTRHEIYLGETFSPSTDYTPNMITHAADFTGDGWPDVLATEMRPMVLYVNPRGENRRWDRHEVMPEVISEATILRDMDGDGQPEIVYAFGQGTLAYAEPDPANPLDPWIVHEISDPMGFGTTIHGLGAGDVNGDGRHDILIRNGWFEQPAQNATGRKWTFHAFPFTDAGHIRGAGGGNMSVVDLNGDGLNDVATSLNAHGWGLAWFEQTRDASGNISFIPHLIMGDFTTDNPGDATFSELHAGVETIDMDNDGRIDLVTGKRYWAHLDSSTDPDPYGEAVLYWYKNVADSDAPGGISFAPELIHNKSGVGSQFEVHDMNRDGATDIITSTDRGTFVFWGER